RVHRRGKTKDLPGLRCTSHKISERSPHFLRSSKQAVLRRFFGSAQGVANGAKPHSLVMAHFEDHPLTRGEARQNIVNTAAQLRTKVLSLGIDASAFLGQELKTVYLAVARRHSRLLFLAHLTLANLIET